MTETDTPIETIIDRIEQWLIELESGRHKQGMCYLRDADSCFCCLGVAAEYVLDASSELRDERYIYTFDITGTDGRKLTSDGALEDHHAIGLWHYTGQSQSGNGMSLAHMNDSGKSFTEIAAILRDDLVNSYYGYFIDAVYPAWRAKNGVKA